MNIMIMKAKRLVKAALSLILITVTSCVNSDTKQEQTKLQEGDIVWQSGSIGENLESAPALDDYGNIYIIGGGLLHSYKINGDKRWAMNVNAVDFNTPSVSNDNSAVYCGGSNGLYALNTDDGSVKWHASGFPAGFHSVPAVSGDDSRIYVGIGAERDEGDNFYCFDAASGNVIWKYVMSHEAYGFHGYLGGAIIGNDGRIYLTSQHGWLLSLTDNGDHYRENWACRIGAEMRMPPAMDDNGFIYVGDSESGQIHKIDSRTGIESGGNWPVGVNTQSSEQGEVFANIAIGDDGTIYANSEDERLWAITPDGDVKWNNLQFEVWGSDPLIRDDGKIIVVSQIKGSARVTCIRDNGDSAVLEWMSEPVTETLFLNETNVNIAPDGTILVHSGDKPPLALFALKGNGKGLSRSAQWPKYMGNIKNNGNFIH
jgi:outer membrane protein assembly factor BamB